MAFSNGQAEMNVTPLIDVLLVLIIIFMIIVPVAPNGERALLPRDSKGPVTDPIRTIVIQLHADHSVTINEEPVAWEDLKARLTSIFKERVERVAFVKADPDLEFQPVAEVIDIAHAAGVDNVGLMR
jgi:biopolymer transport protein ExbD